MCATWQVTFVSETNVRVHLAVSDPALARPKALALLLGPQSATAAHHIHWAQLFAERGIRGYVAAFEEQTTLPGVARFAALGTADPTMAQAPSPAERPERLLEEVLNRIGDDLSGSLWVLAAVGPRAAQLVAAAHEARSPILPPALAFLGSAPEADFQGQVLTTPASRQPEPKDVAVWITDFLAPWLLREAGAGVPETEGDG